jgi:outer membrane protein OmpA-like peptidoglycan-associated protein
LDILVEMLTLYKEAFVDIEGHTDNVGKSEANKKLSQGRADAVKAYLVSKGIDESRLTAIGYGDEKPVADNKTAAGKAKNRRVDFNIKY